MGMGGGGGEDPVVWLEGTARKYHGSSPSTPSTDDAVSTRPLVYSCALTSENGQLGIHRRIKGAHPLWSTQLKDIRRHLPWSARG